MKVDYKKINIFKRLIRRLTCEHDQLVFEGHGDWTLKFETPIGFFDTDIRPLYFKCENCGETLEVTQSRHHHQLLDYKEYTMEDQPYVERNIPKVKK